MTLSAFGFALMGACVKASSLRGIPVVEILAARAFISLSLSYAGIKRKKINPWGKNKLLLTIRGIVGTAALFCIFYAIKLLPLAAATLLQYLYPLFITILAAIFLKEAIQFRTLICIVFSLTGLFVMSQPDFFSGNTQNTNITTLPVAGIIAALFGAFGTSIAYVIVRKLSKTEAPSVIIFYFPFIALPVSCFFLSNDFIIPRGIDWFLLLFVGTSTQFAQYYLTKAMQVEKAGKAAAYSYIQIIFAAILGFLCFEEVPTCSTIIGGLLIIGGAFVNMTTEESK